MLSAPFRLSPTAAIRTGVAVTLAVVALVSTPARPATVAWGTLKTEPGTAAIEAANGITVSMLEFSWAQEEPSPGVFDTAYEASMRARYSALQRAGLRVTLGLGLHFTPAWVAALPGSRYVDQNGNTSQEVNFVFNPNIRRLAENYLARLATVVPIKDLWAIRITSGGDPELLYPPGGNYWAFDSSAQNRTGLPDGMARNPFPGWRPGQPGLNASQMNAWVDWYVNGLANVAGWQTSLAVAGGFRGFFQIVTPGIGATPAVLATVVSRNLVPGIVGVGAVWDRLYARLPLRSNVIAYVSSLADGSGGNSSCAAGDISIPLGDPSTATWSAARWISRIADGLGLGKAGENTGYSTPALQASYRDTSANGMAAVTARQARDCGFQVAYWAHDDQLWDGTLAFSTLLGWVRPTGVAPLFPTQ